MTSQSKDSLNFVDFFLDLVDLAEDFGLPVFNDLAVFCNNNFMLYLTDTT